MLIRSLQLLALMGFTLPVFAQSLDEILTNIEALEARRDPKCYATAARLEDFMYGTPLSEEARFQKNRLQKYLAEVVWRKAGAGKHSISPVDIDAAFGQFITFRISSENNHILIYPSQSEIKIGATDIRHYGTVAYSLRAILAVQQDTLLDAEKTSLPALSSEAIEAFKNKLDLTTLGLLQEADAYARVHDEYEISLDNINRAWLTLFKEPAEKPAAASGTTVVFSSVKPPLLQKIIDQKISSFAKYNQISNQLFVRNMQVYFARLSWPTDATAAEAFRLGLIDAVVGYAVELYKGSVDVAAKNGAQVVGEEHVARFVQHFTPHEVNEYEDVVFFPDLPARKVTLEAYDLDAFRDSGVHWLYLGHALDSGEITQFLEVDPFAAELLTENIAQFGVLLLREAGLEGARRGEERLSLELLAAAVGIIQENVSATLAARADPKAEAIRIRSADADVVRDADRPETWFADRTEAVGIDLMHRSSDWLNRLLRSYLRRDETTGIITIPPAFGGSGVAAGDVNNDGKPDILLLSGLGNKLYLNDGKGHFSDVTRTAKLEFIRPEDNRAGESRQPLIADLDNDGWQDIVITYVDDNHRVYRNSGDGTFTDMTERAALGGKGLVGGPATVFDYDNDGLLDVYVVYFGDYTHGVLPTLKRRNSNGLPNMLFKNLGGFQFKEVKAGVEDSGWGQAVAHTDFNLDKLQDLIVGNDFGSNVYYQNMGNGKFEDVSAAMGVDKPSYTMNIGLADLNSDQVPDVYISNIVTMNKDEKYVLPNEDMQMKFNLEKLANLRVVEANDLFISSRAEDGTVSYSLNRDLVGRGYNSTGWSWGASFFDADQDGDDDLYVLNGMNEFNLYSSKNAYADAGVKSDQNTYLPVDTKETNVFFVNSGGKLNNVTGQSGLDLLGNSRSAAYLDYDNDGDLDIIVNNYHEPARFFQNGAERLKTHWIKLRLEGDPSQGVNRDAIGARVIIKLPDGNQIWREVHGSGAYLTVHDKTVHAGLGRLETADVEITWPGGIQQTFSNLAANKVHTIKMASEVAR